MRLVPRPMDKLSCRLKRFFTNNFLILFLSNTVLDAPESMSNLMALPLMAASIKRWTPPSSSGRNVTGIVILLEEISDMNLIFHYGLNSGQCFSLEIFQ